VSSVPARPPASIGNYSANGQQCQTARV